MEASAKCGALPLAESQLIAEAEEFSLCPSEIQDKLIVRFTVYNVASRTSLSIKCKLGETVLQLKERLSSRFVFYIPVAQQNLAFGARILDDSHTLAEAGVFFGAMLQLVTNQAREVSTTDPASLIRIAHLSVRVLGCSCSFPLSNSRRCKMTFQPASLVDSSC